MKIQNRISSFLIFILLIYFLIFKFFKYKRIEEWHNLKWIEELRKIIDLIGSLYGL